MKKCISLLILLALLTSALSVFAQFDDDMMIIDDEDFDTEFVDFDDEFEAMNLRKKRMMAGISKVWLPMIISTSPLETPHH